jgi:hypothetical protein
MNIPHEVEELILEFVGLKRKKRCIAQTKSNRICLRRTDNWILCTQHMKRLNTVTQNKSISPTFVNLCIVIHQAMQHADAYRRRKDQRNAKGNRTKTYQSYPPTNSIIQMLL